MALVAIAAAVIGNAILLVDDGVELALLGRAVVGIGSGAAFVAGLDLVRAGGGGAALQGLYGGATMAGGGLALMVVPPLTDATSWRAAYWSAALLAVLAAIPTLLASGLPRVGHAGAWVLRDRALLPIGVLQAATFGLAVIAGNWVVPLLERQGVSSAAAGLAGGLVLFVGILTRPLGGLLAGRVPGRLLVGVRARRNVRRRAPARARRPARGLRARRARPRPHGRSSLRRDLRGRAAHASRRAGVRRSRSSTRAPSSRSSSGRHSPGSPSSSPSDGRLAFAVIAVLAAAALLPLRAARL